MAYCWQLNKARDVYFRTVYNNISSLAVVLASAHLVVIYCATVGYGLSEFLSVCKTTHEL